MANKKLVGTVARITIFPVKSMRGCDVAEAQLGWHGLNGDRRYAFVQTGSMDGFPWLTARELPSMLLFEPVFDEQDHGKSPVSVKTPDGRAMPVESPLLAKELATEFGAGVHLMRLDRGAFDALPMSLISDRSVDAIASELGSNIEPARFRANIMIQAQESRPFQEDEWIGESLVFGDDGDPATVQVNARDSRCKIVNINPRTGIADAALLKTIAQTRRNLLGAYGSTHHPGRISLGDPVYSAI